MLKLPIAIAIIALLFSTSVSAQENGGKDVNDEFFAAARHGDIAAVKAFLDKGTDVNTKTRYGSTALFYACDRGNVEMVKFLLERGADPNTKDTFYGATPMTWAADKGHVEVVRLLVEKGAKEKDDALAVGVDKGSIELVKTVLDKGGVSAGAMTKALTKANEGKKTEIAEALTKAGAVPFQTVSEEVLKSYTGTYKNDQAGELTIAVKEGKLSGQFKGQGSFTIGALSKTSFAVIEFDGVVVEFNLENDKVTSLTWRRSEGAFQFKKVQ